MKSIIALSLLLVAGCSGLPDYVEPLSDVPSAGFKVKHNFDAPFLGYSTFVNVHTEDETCGESFYSESGAQIVVLDDMNPLISELNPDGVKLAAGKKYSFMILSVAGMNSCGIYASFEPEANKNYEMSVSGKLLGSYSTQCKAELYLVDESANRISPVEFLYYGQCREATE